MESNLAKGLYMQGKTKWRWFLGFTVLEGSLNDCGWRSLVMALYHRTASMYYFSLRIKRSLLVGSASLCVYVASAVIILCLNICTISGPYSRSMTLYS